MRCLSTFAEGPFSRPSSSNGYVLIGVVFERCDSINLAFFFMCPACRRRTSTFSATLTGAWASTTGSSSSTFGTSLSSSMTCFSSVGPSSRSSWKNRCLSVQAIYSIIHLTCRFFLFCRPACGEWHVGRLQRPTGDGQLVCLVRCPPLPRLLSHVQHADRHA